MEGGENMNKKDIEFFFGMEKYQTLDERVIEEFIDLKYPDIVDLAHKVLDIEAERRSFNTPRVIFTKPEAIVGPIEQAKETFKTLDVEEKALFIKMLRARTIINKQEIEEERDKWNI